MVNQIREDICSGADGSEFRCGVIGEIGCTWPLTGVSDILISVPYIVRTSMVQTLTGMLFLLYLCS